MPRGDRHRDSAHWWGRPRVPDQWGPDVGQRERPGGHIAAVTKMLATLW